jgi:hypothetical protein
MNGYRYKTHLILGVPEVPGYVQIFQPQVCGRRWNIVPKQKMANGREHNQISDMGPSNAPSIARCSSITGFQMTK